MTEALLNNKGEGTMAGEPTITVIGRIGQDPNVNFSKDGKAVANFSVGVTPSARVNDTWQDKDTMWFSVSLWRNAEEFVNTANKGALVMATGRLTLNTYTSKDGEQKTSWQIDADAVGIVPTPQRARETVAVDSVPW